MSWAKLILELLTIWKQLVLMQKQEERNELIEKGRDNPSDAFNEHFNRLHSDEHKTNAADKAKN